nr:immunoglobulin heavy chain junction region [Mus musculus]
CVYYDYDRVRWAMDYW